MIIEKQLTTFEQAKKLHKLGLSAQGYFVHEVYSDGTLRCTVPYSCRDKNYYCIPTWTVAELGVMLDDFVGFAKKNTKGIWEAKFKPIIPGAATKRILDATVATFTLHNSEAEARGELLIHLLQGAWLDADKSNERLIKFSENA